MASEADFRRLADEVCNWGRSGDDDELGTLNFLTDERRRHAATLVERGAVFSLANKLDRNGPQNGSYPYRHNPFHMMTLDGTSEEFWASSSPDGRLVRWTDDYLTLPLQAGTQWDALAHVYYEGQPYNGYPSATVGTTGALRDGIDSAITQGITGRGVLLDIARLQGVDHVAAKTPIQPEDLDRAAERQGVEIRSGDIVLVRTGWWPVFERTRDGERWTYDSPGLGYRCAEWLHEHELAAVATDNIGLEVIASEIDRIGLPLHGLCLRDMGMMFGEMWNLEALAADCVDDGVWEFLLTAPPLHIPRAVGSPVNPIAMK